MLRKTTYHFITYAFIICLCSAAAAQTSTIGGVINQYAKVNTIAGNVVTLSSEAEAEAMFGSPFSPGRQDTVLLIQMTGLLDAGTAFKGAGRYEFHIVTDVVGSTVTLKTAIDQSDLSFQFNPRNEIVQLIRVPSYKNALIDRELKCDPFNWSGGTGGVLALFVQDSLIFNADINVSGCGFNGGKTYEPSIIVECIALPLSPPPPPLPNYANLGPFSDVAGKKGEGAGEKENYDRYPEGYGKTWNGGGGGVGKWSGGGGGANGGDGGPGGNQYCGDLGWIDGNFGTGIKYDEIYDISRYPISNFVYMGGGGGAGTGVNGSNGGNGGGIVIIVAQNMKFKNGAWIKSAGNSVTEAPKMAGAGGGGGGGTILLSVKNYEKMRVDISGGKGGDVSTDSDDCYEANTGVGGGGSGGFLYTMDMMKNQDWDEDTDSLKKTRGACGNIISSTLPNCPNGSQRNGNAGKNNSGFNVQLRGFLNNYIFTPDAVCYNEHYNEPVTIQASDPLGGTGVFSYEWFSSTDGLDWKLIVDANNRDLLYRFTDDIWLQRKVTSGGIIDFGLPVMIHVHDRIINQIIQNDTFCREDKIKIGGETPTGGGGDYSYQWEEQKDDKTWGIVELAMKDREEILSLIYIENPPTVLTNQYRRIVTSGAGCRSISNTSTIIVHRSIEGNIIDGNVERCEDISLVLTAPIPTGGDGTEPRYEWQIMKDDQDWIDAPGVNYEKDYTFSVEDYNRSFRRIVESGKCNKKSEPVKVYSKPRPEILTQPATLNLQFNMELKAVKPDLGSGFWSSSDDNLKFIPTPPNLPNVKVEDLKQGVYTFKWTVKNGECVSDTSVEITVIDIFFPKGFSPNGDDYNNCFRIKGAENAKQSKIIIFDRYNNIVFEDDEFGKKGNSNYEKNKDCTGWWDGSDKNGKELPSGVYYYRYTFRLEGEINERINNGYVVLRR